MRHLVVPTASGQPLTGHVWMGDPAGRPDAIAVTSRYLTRSGRPWFPIMGEFHFARYPAAKWAEELRKIRAGGVGMIATYVFWNLHEEQQGHFDWSGDRDLRAFVQDCARAGLEVVLRLGPWAHGESRNGGFPDWLLAQPVRPPAHRRPRLPRPRPHVPGADGWPQQSRAHYFLGHGRDDDSIGAGLRPAATGDAATGDAATGDAATDGGATDGGATDGGATSDGGRSEAHLARYPFAACELGGGMYTSYHRRPIVTADDIGALALVKIGSGSSMQGYYLYHGGSQKIGIRPSWFALRRLHLWLSDHGSRLAPMTLRLPADAPADTTDRTTLRWAVRADADSGYLFVNNHQPVEPLPEHADVRFTVRLGDRETTVPTHPVTIPTGAHFAWPLHQRIGPVRLVSATAQPLCDLLVDGVPTAVLGATAGIAVELTLDAASDAAVDPPAVAVDAPATVTAEDGQVLVAGIQPGPHALVRITGTDGRPAAILVLDETSALQATRGRLWGADRLVLCAAPIVLDQGAVVSHGPSAPLLVYPPVAGHPRHGVFSVHRPPVVDAALVPATVTRLRQAGPARRPVLDAVSGRASAPVDDDFADACVLHVSVPEDLFTDPDTEALLRVDWIGDVGRAYVDGRPIADQFWYGPAWEIALRRVRSQAVAHGVELRLLPLAQDAPIFVSPQVRPGAYPPGGVLDVRQVQLVRRRRTILTEPPAAPEHEQDRHEQDRLR